MLQTSDTALRYTSSEGTRVRSNYSPMQAALRYTLKGHAAQILIALDHLHSTHNAAALSVAPHQFCPDCMGPHIEVLLAVIL